MAVRILYCEGNVDGTVGGSYYSLLHLLEGLDRERFTPLLILHRDTPFRARFESVCAEVRIVGKPRPFQIRENSGGPDNPLRATRFCTALLQSSVNFLRFWLFVATLARLLRRERIDLVHLNNSVTSNHHWMLAAWLTRTPCITHERGINHQFTSLARWLAPRLAAIICISKAAQDALIERAVSLANLHLIHNGLDPETVVPRQPPADVRHHCGIPAGSRVIGLIGNIRRWKGQEVLVKALPAIVERCPDVTCLFVGQATTSDALYEAHLHELIQGFGLTSHVPFVGFSSNVADLLNVMDIAVHASITPEPFGRVLLEAMAMKKPVVASRDGGVLEIVVDGTTGLTFPPGDSDALAAAVISLLQQPATAKSMGEAGYRRLLSDFHIARNVERTMAVYTQVLAA